MSTDGPGRGKRQCPTCQHYIGVRNQSCKFCNTEFVLKKSELAPKKQSVVEPITRRPVNIGYIFTPGTGSPGTHKICPIPLRGKDEITVREWIKESQLFAWGQNLEYTCIAFKYMAQVYYPRLIKSITNEEYTEVCNVITKVMQEDEEKQETYQEPDVQPTQDT